MYGTRGMYVWKHVARHVLSHTSCGANVGTNCIVLDLIQMQLVCMFKHINPDAT